MGFGIKLKEILSDKGMTMTELSKRTGITYNMIKKYCSGNADPTFSYAQLIAQELELSLDAFMSYLPESNKSMLQQVFEEDFTFICGFMRNVHKFGEKTAVIDPASGRMLTYKELNREVNMLANALFARHVEIGDVVLYQFPNSVEFLCCYLAPQKIGAVNSPIDYHFSPEETARCLNISKPKVYIYDSSIADTARKALILSNWKPEYVLMAGKGVLPYGHMYLADFIEGYPKYNPHVEYCLWVYDESTRLYEQDPDGVMTGIQLFSLNEVLSAHEILMKIPMHISDISMTVMPWSCRPGLHCGGPTSTFYAGGTVVILRDPADFSNEMVFDYVEQFHVSYLAGRTSDLVKLADYKITPSGASHSLKGVLMTGDLPSPADRKKIQEQLCPVVISGFGTAESFWNVFSSSLSMDDKDREAEGFIGNSCVDDDVRIAKLISGELPDPMLLAARDGREVGELIIRSSKTSYKYIGDHRHPEGPLCYKDGWLYTGYLATWDKNRRITIVGQKPGNNCSRTPAL